MINFAVVGLRDNAAGVPQTVDGDPFSQWRAGFLTNATGSIGAAVAQ